MFSPDCIPPNLNNNRFPSIPHLNLPPTPDHLTRSPSTTPNSAAPRFFSPLTNSAGLLQPNVFSFSRQPSPSRNKEFIPEEQEQIDRDYFNTFNIKQQDEMKAENQRNDISIINGNLNIFCQDLMNLGVDNGLSILDEFDPLKQDNRPQETATIEMNQTSTTIPPVVIINDDVPSSPVASVSSPSFPYPIKLRLKVAAYPEMKPFSQIVQQIRDKHQSKQTSTDEVFYCKHVQRPTSQHIEQNQLLVTLHIFIDGFKEPKRLEKISLQSTVSHILYQLFEIIPFDYDQSILKLRSREEYLRHDDVLCDIEYVYNCIHSLKQPQFVLVKKPISSFLQNPKQFNISFEQFCLNQQEKYFFTNDSRTLKKSKSLQSMKSLNKKLPDQIRPFLASDSRWLEEFRRSINQVLKQIEQSFNQLFNPNSPISSINEQIKLVQELNYLIRNIQAKCSDIQSSLLGDKQYEIKLCIVQLIKKSQNENEQILSPQIVQNITRLLSDLLITLVNYIQTYCQAFLIPYEVEIYNEENATIDIERFKYSSTAAIITNPRLISESSELFSVYIDSVFSLPSNVKTIRVVVRLCYGNKMNAKQMTKLMSYVRNNSHENASQVRFAERLSFHDAHLCELQREALLLFEVYATFIDETDSALSSLVSEVFDAIPMRLIGWCSQALFDNEHYLITGERYLGIIDASTTNRIGFCSLRNVYERDCSVLTVSFSNQSVFWEDVQPRNDMQAKNFIEISQEKQEYLCRLLDRPSLLLVDHSTMITNDSLMDKRKQQSSTNMSDMDCEFSVDECHFLWSQRHRIIHNPPSNRMNKLHALPKLLKSRSVWDFPSLIDIYGLVNEAARDQTIDEIESFELLLPAFPDMYIRSFAYRLLISRVTSHDLIIYLPQLLQIIKYDYNYSSPIIEYLLKQSVNDHRLAHQLYWYLRQLLLTENIHFIRYYYIFMSLLYILEDTFRIELQNEYNLCMHLQKIGSDLKNNKSNKGYFLTEQLKALNNDFFQSGKQTCRLPCQFSFITNNIDFNSCSTFNSLTSPMKLVFNPVNSLCEKYYSIYKIGDDLRQDQIILQLLSCMDKIWQVNDFDFRLSIFNVVQTQERCGFIEMITESETLLEIESRLGTIKGSFGESALYDWLRLHNTTERDLRIAVENLTYSCAAYCVATYILGIGDRHNENIMVKKSGHLFHIDFGKYLGDRQKFGWFNRDRAPFVFTKQMLYAMSDSGLSNDAMHRFIDLCCNAFHTLRQNSSLLLLLLSHLCSSNVPNLNYDAVRFVYDRLALSLNYAESITHFTELILDSLNSTWTTWNSFIHSVAQTGNSNNSSNTISTNTAFSFVSNAYTIVTDEKIVSAQVIDCEKRTHPSKHYLYKLKVERLHPTYHYRTYNEFNEFYERLNKQFPLISIDFKFSGQTETKDIAQRHVNDLNEFLANLFGLTTEIFQSDLVRTFFHMIPRDQQINDIKEKPNNDLSPRSLNDPSTNNQPKIRIHLHYDNGKLFVLVRHANNLPLTNGNEPKPYCKCYLFPDESKSTKRKGRPANSRNPIFNDTFTYEMDLAEIQKRVLRVSVWNNILSVGNHVLGSVNIALTTIDWSKESACHYTFTSPEM